VRGPQDADKQRPYYGRGLVLFARASRKNDASRPGLGWIKAQKASSHVRYPNYQAGCA